jgi:hypothetical protein
MKNAVFWDIKTSQKMPFLIFSHGHLVVFYSMQKELLYKEIHIFVLRSTTICYVSNSDYGKSESTAKSTMFYGAIVSCLLKFTNVLKECNA